MVGALRNHLSRGRLLAAAAIMTALGLTLFFLARPAPAKAAPQRSGGSACSVRTLHGNYAGNLSGTSAAAGPVALQVEVTFNGDGTGTADVTLMTQTQGPVIFISADTYTLGRNCSGTLTAVRGTGQTVHYAIASTPGGIRIYFLQTDAGSVVTGTLDRL